MDSNVYQRRLLLGLASYSSGEGDTPLTEEIYKVSRISRRSFFRNQRNQLAPTESYIPELSLGKPVLSTYHLEIFRVLRLSRTTRSESIL